MFRASGGMLVEADHVSSGIAELRRDLRRVRADRLHDHSPYTKGNLGSMSGLAVGNQLAVDPSGLECYGEW